MQRKFDEMKDKAHHAFSGYRYKWESVAGGASAWMSFCTGANGGIYMYTPVHPGFLGLRSAAIFGLTAFGVRKTGLVTHKDEKNSYAAAELSGLFVAGLSLFSCITGWNAIRHYGKKNLKGTITENAAFRRLGWTRASLVTFGVVFPFAAQQLGDNFQEMLNSVTNITSTPSASGRSPIRFFQQKPPMQPEQAPSADAAPGTPSQKRPS